jgi:hypothetical protein
MASALTNGLRGRVGACFIRHELCPTYCASECLIGLILKVASEDCATPWSKERSLSSVRILAGATDTSSHVAQYCLSVTDERFNRGSQTRVPPNFALVVRAMRSVLNAQHHVRPARGIRREEWTIAM